MARMSTDTRHILIGAATCVAIALFFVLGYSGNPAKREGNGYRLAFMKMPVVFPQAAPS